MTQPREYSLDFLRALCALQVFFLHYVVGIGHREWAIYFCGAVPTFLLMSAYLYGKRPDARFGWKFLMKRFVALSASYYPFVLFTFLYFLLAGGGEVRLLARGLVVDLLYLGGIGAGYNLPHCGHLWFMSTLGLCYLALSMCGKRTWVRKTMTCKYGVFAVTVLALATGMVYRGG